VVIAFSSKPVRLFLIAGVVTLPFSAPLYEGAEWSFLLSVY
jgi:hypothetical protein